MSRLTKHLMDLRGEIRRAQRRKRTLCAAEEKKKKCRDFHIKVATEICRFCKGSTTEALRFLEMKGCSREDGHPWSHPAVLDLATASVVEPCADASVQPADDAITSVMKAAQSFLLEHRTFDWVRFQNENKGLTPLLQATVEQYERLQKEICPHAQVRALPKSASGKWKWARRWAKAWTMRRGKLKAGVCLTLQQRCEKARSYSWTKPSPILFQLLQPFPRGRPVFWPPKNV